MEPTTCFYLLMQIVCWLHVVFVLIFIIYFFIYSKRCQQKQRKSPPAFIYLCKLIVDYMWFSFLIFSIYLFIYSKRCQQKQVEATTCFYLLMQITYCYIWFSFEYPWYFYLFIQSDVNKSIWNRPPVFIYLLKSLVVTRSFRFNIQYLFVYLFKLTSIETGGTDHLFLFTYANYLLWHMVFILIFTIYFFIYWNSCQQKQLGCARFPDFMQNFSERQVLWSLCSVDFHTLTLQLPIQNLHSVAPELQVFVSSLENCANFRENEHTPGTNHLFLFTCLWISHIPFVIFYVRIFLTKIGNNILHYLT